LKVRRENKLVNNLLTPRGSYGGGFALQEQDQSLKKQTQVEKVWRLPYSILIGRKNMMMDRAGKRGIKKASGRMFINKNNGRRCYRSERERGEKNYCE